MDKVPLRRRRNPRVEGQQHGLSLCYCREEILGFVVYADERLPRDVRDEALSVIHDDLQEINRILPVNATARLHSHPLCIWVNLNSGAGKLGCCCHCVDLPGEYMACKSHSVEIFDARDFLQQRHVQPAQLLHEISHWMHHDAVQQERCRAGASEWRPSSGRVANWEGPHLFTDPAAEDLAYRF